MRGFCSTGAAALIAAAVLASARSARAESPAAARFDDRIAAMDAFVAARPPGSEPTNEELKQRCDSIRMELEEARLPAAEETSLSNHLDDVVRRLSRSAEPRGRAAPVASGPARRIALDGLTAAAKFPDAERMGLAFDGGGAAFEGAASFNGAAAPAPGRMGTTTAPASAYAHDGADASVPAPIHLTGRAVRGAAPSGRDSVPFLPLAAAAAAGLGLAAYGVVRSKAAYESASGLDDAHPVVAGPLQRFVAGAALAAAAGGLLYLAGAAVAGAAEAVVVECGVVNEVPGTLARVIPLQGGVRVSGMLGPAGQATTFVTAAEDIADMPAVRLSERLGIEPASRYAIIRFPTPPAEVASRIEYEENPLFIGRGVTSGGAREFQIPNVAIPPNSTIEIVGDTK